MKTIATALIACMFLMAGATTNAQQKKAAVPPPLAKTTTIEVWTITDFFKAGDGFVIEVTSTRGTKERSKYFKDDVYLLGAFFHPNGRFFQTGSVGLLGRSFDSDSKQARGVALADLIVRIKLAARFVPK